MCVPATALRMGTVCMGGIDGSRKAAASILVWRPRTGRKHVAVRHTLRKPFNWPGRKLKPRKANMQSACVHDALRHKVCSSQQAARSCVSIASLAVGAGGWPTAEAPAHDRPQMTGIEPHPGSTAVCPCSTFKSTAVRPFLSFLWFLESSTCATWATRACRSVPTSAPCLTAPSGCAVGGGQRAVLLRQSV